MGSVVYTCSVFLISQGPRACWKCERRPQLWDPEAAGPQPCRWQAVHPREDLSLSGPQFPHLCRFCGAVLECLTSQERQSAAPHKVEISEVRGEPVGLRGSGLLSANFGLSSDPTLGNRVTLSESVPSLQLSLASSLENGDPVIHSAHVC